MKMANQEPIRYEEADSDISKEDANPQILEDRHQVLGQERCQIATVMEWTSKNCTLEIVMEELKGVESALRHLYMNQAKLLNKKEKLERVIIVLKGHLDTKHRVPAN